MHGLDTSVAKKCSTFFKSNVRETWRVILVREADIFLSESLRILAERLSQSEIGLPLRQICYYSPPEEVGVFSTEINFGYFYCIVFDFQMQGYRTKIRTSILQCHKNKFSKNKKENLFDR